MKKRKGKEILLRSFFTTGKKIELSLSDQKKAKQKKEEREKQRSKGPRFLSSVFPLNQALQFRLAQQEQQCSDEGRGRAGPRRAALLDRCEDAFFLRERKSEVPLLLQKKKRKKKRPAVQS